MRPVVDPERMRRLFMALEDEAAGYRTRPTRTR
jgi:hypothetical protein